MNAVKVSNNRAGFSLASIHSSHVKYIHFLDSNTSLCSIGLANFLFL